VDDWSEAGATAMMSFFAPRSPADPAQVSRIKAWALELLTTDPAVPMLVTELRCTEPGCAPLETVIALLGVPGGTVQYTVHKPLSAVCREDLVGLRPKGR